MLMLMGGVARHGLFHPLVIAEREFFHLGQITLADFRWHRLADGNEMCQHVGLALCAERGDFILLRQSFGGIVCQRGQFAFGGGDFLAQLAALRQITFVQLADVSHLGVAQVKFQPQPVQIVRRLLAARHCRVPRAEKRAGKNRRAQRQRADEDDERTVHSTNGVRSDGGEIVQLGVVPGELPAVQRAGENSR